MQNKCTTILSWFALSTSLITVTSKNFHVEPPWDGGMKVCSNGPGHMTNMAAMPIKVKTFKKSSFLEPNSR